MDELCERVCKPKNTLIVYHVRSDADAVGSAFALREILMAMSIPTLCVCADEVPERLRFLTDSAQGSVVLDDGIDIDHDRVISVDSASPEQLGSLYKKLHYDMDVMIDHHGTGTPYADHYIDPDAAATGEIIYTLAKRLVERGDLSEIPKRALMCIYAAICSDTGSFRFANVTPKTFRIAAELLEAGVQGDEICRALYESKSEKQVRAEGEAARRLLIRDGGKIASVTFPYTSKHSLALSDEHLETIIDIPRSIYGVEVAFCVKQPEQNNTFRVSMRSAGDIDVAAICAKFGGGGHKRAAGCTVEACHIDDAEEKILEAIRSVMNR
jgi:phosphoesterase RecJ-like protein